MWLFRALFLLAVPVCLLPQSETGHSIHTAPLQDIHVNKKQGESLGEAVIVVNGKPRRLAKDVYQAWPVMHGANALILIRQKDDPRGECQLRYVEGDNLKRRDLGTVPFTNAELKEEALPDDRMAFVLSGHSGSGQTVIIADRNTVHAEIVNVKSLEVQPDKLSYQPADGGEIKSISLQTLIGSDLRGIYEVKPPTADRIRYAQFDRDGTSFLLDEGGATHVGRWRTDGFNLTVKERDEKGNELHAYRLSHSDLVSVQGIPAATRLTVRLLHPLSSFKTKEGDPVEAVLISPPFFDGKLYLPQGAIFSGTITKVRDVGWAVPHETAALTVEFTSVKVNTNVTVPIHATLDQVENAQETVTNKGTIQGVRSTGTLGHSAESKVASVAAFEPVAYLFTTVSATSILGFAEPEILYNAGTELLVKIASPVVTDKTYPPTSPGITHSPQQFQQLTDAVHKLPFRTTTKGSNKPSDVTNLVFLGSPSALMRAFKAAGWVETDELTANSTFMTLKTLGGNQAYTQAPMSILLLDERPPIFALSKTTNTFNSRHHLRVFDPLQQYGGQTMLTASSTQDIGIGFSAKQKTFIHLIDEYIDNERSKIVQDLQFTGCVQAAEYVSRPWVPTNAYNSTGDKLRTDGAAVVLQMNDCQNPRTGVTENAVPPGRFQRIVRDTVLTIRNDLVRGNLAYQGVSGTIWARNYFIHRNDLKPSSGAWLQTDLSGESFKGQSAIARPGEEEDEEGRGLQERGPASPSAPDPEVIRARESHKWDPPRYEIGLQGGYLRYPSTRQEGVVLLLNGRTPADGDYFTILADQVDGGWTAGIYVIANTWKWLSNEFSYNYQRGRYEAINISGPAEENVTADEVTLDGNNIGLVTRQFEYNLLWNLKSPKSRWRPYLAAGPALQLMSLDGAAFKKASGPFRIGLQNIGILKAAFDFGGTPPLEGGGIWELGLQYGAGIKYRVLPRLTINADFRETWSKNPDFIRNSYTEDYYSDENYQLTVIPINAESKFRQERFTFGFAFTF
jgi:opacity protein-like surface antigen